MIAAERLAAAAEALEKALARLDAQRESLETKVDRIVAAVEEQQSDRHGDEQDGGALRARVTELERVNTELKAQAARAGRKTLPPMVSLLLAKNGMEDEHFESSALDKVLAPLSLEQRIAIKAEMARAGMIE
ncbi:MAG TPA: hypothetical protein VFG86_09110 [Chloroflexota bacterium]|nr:hypothetical protein [Chloroflexota bacterium]